MPEMKRKMKKIMKKIPIAKLTPYAKKVLEKKPEKAFRIAMYQKGGITALHRTVPGVAPKGAKMVLARAPYVGGKSAAVIKAEQRRDLLADLKAARSASASLAALKAKRKKK